MNETSKFESQHKEKDKTSTILAFCIFGCLIHVMYSVILSGAQDILAGTNIPTTTLLCALMVPPFLVEIIAPYFMKKAPYLVLISINFSCVSLGFVVVAYVKQVEWKCAGIGLAGCGLAFGAVSIVSLSSYFTPLVTSAYATGTGIGLLAGSLYYTALTTWLCVSPNTTIVVLSPLSVVFLVSYFVINRNKTRDLSTNHVDYTKVQDSDTDDCHGEETDDAEHEKPVREHEFLTRKEKMLMLAKLFSISVVPCFAIISSQYLLTQAVITTIAYSNAPFRPRDHYQYYILTFMIGELMGRSYRSIIHFINPRWLYAPTLKLLWVLTIIEIMLLFLGIFESWYRFLFSVGIFLLLCFLTGFVVGFFYDNMLVLLHIAFEGKEREFIMGFSLFPVTAGIIIAGVVGLYVEPRLFGHCISEVADSASCFTRPNHFNDIMLGCRLQHN